MSVLDVKLADFEDEPQATANTNSAVGSAAVAAAGAVQTDGVKAQGPASTVPHDMGTAYASFAVGGFKDFCLKPELSRAIAENGFEHPSEVQHKALPQALLGNDILAQAKSGMGKTAVFVFALLEHIEKPPEDSAKKVQALVIVHTRELAYQIEREFHRFNRSLQYCTTAVVYGGIPMDECAKYFRNPKTIPLILVGTPGRVLALINDNLLDTSGVKYFVLDEFDRCLDDLRMRKDVQAIFTRTPKMKQVMMFSATMSGEMRNLAKRFMNSPLEIYVDQQSKLTLHGLMQFYVEVEEPSKTRKLVDLLDTIDFHQCVIFVNSVQRCEMLNTMLLRCKFPSVCIHSKMEQGERIRTYDLCKSQNSKIVVATDLFGRGIDINRINLVIQYDMAPDADTYLHRVGRAGRFGNKGLTIAFITSDKHMTRLNPKEYTDRDVLNEVQSRFEVHMKVLDDIAALDKKQYMTQ